MSNKILVTDSLFIFDEHVKQLEEAGYEVERLDRPQASEEELKTALKDKVAYVLGGVERVSDTVISAANGLKAIAFTGSDWKAIIPGWESATKKGIAISNAPGGNSSAVSEFAMAIALAMQRQLFDLGRTGKKTFVTTPTFKDATISVIGAGKIGQKIINEAKAFMPKKILYYSRTQKDCGAEYAEFEQILRISDVIFIAAPGTTGQIFNAEAIQKIKDNTLLVSISPGNLIDFEALFKRLKDGTLRAAIDWQAPDMRFNDLPLSTWFNTNNHSAYNTREAAKLCSDMAITSLLNILKTGEDQYLVNPEYKNSAARSDRAV